MRHSPSESSVEKILVFGNSGFGKSTLARGLCAAKEFACLDLDTLASLTEPPLRRADAG